MPALRLLLPLLLALAVVPSAQAAKPSQLVFDLRYGIGKVTFGAPASEKVIEADTATRIPASPVISPNGAEIAYSVYDPTNQKSFLIVRDQRDKVIETLPISLHSGGSVVWSPDGKELAYVCYDGPIFTTLDSVGREDPYLNLCVMTVATGKSRVVATSTAAASVSGQPDPRLSWAPDGTIIASGRTPAPGYHELAGSAKGAGEPFQQFLGDDVRYAQFSPKGDQVTYQDTKGVVVADANGGNVQRIDAPGDGITPFAGPGWSPDAKSLVVSAKGDNGNLDLFEVPLKSGTPKQLTTITPGDDETFASWGPPASTCSVPKLKGKSLAKAKKLIKRAGCTVGKVKGAKRKKVTKQSPKAGREVDPGTKVDLKLG